MKTQENTSRTAPPPPPAKRYRRPTTLSRVKGELGEVVVKLKSGTIDAKTANALVYTLSTLAGVISDSDLERRLAALEGATKPPAWRPGPLLAPLPTLRIPGGEQ